MSIRIHHGLGSVKHLVDRPRFRIQVEGPGRVRRGVRGRRKRWLFSTRWSGGYSRRGGGGARGTESRGDRRADLAAVGFEQRPCGFGLDARHRHDEGRLETPSQRSRISRAARRQRPPARGASVGCGSAASRSWPEVDRAVAQRLADPHHRDGGDHVEDHLGRGPGLQACRAGDDLGPDGRGDIEVDLAAQQAGTVAGDADGHRPAPPRTRTAPST